MGYIENKLKAADSAIHDWYRFILSFPPHLVQQYLEELGADKFEFTIEDEQIVKVNERHYKIVDAAEISTNELQTYRIHR